MHHVEETRSVKESICKVLKILSIISILCGQPAIHSASARVETPVAQPLHYADIADLATAAPLIIKGQIRGTKKVNVASADGSTPPIKYYFVRADVEALIRGDDGVPSAISFLIKASAENKDTASKPRRGQKIILFARKAGTPGQLQLISRRAMLPWSEDVEATTRAVITEHLKPDTPPAIVGVGDAFHVPGTIAGEGETQIFVKTANGAPVSLSIIHRPGQPPRWGVSLGEIVDETAVPPARETLLWYRLACGLPPSLPPESTRGLPLRDAESARRDYRMVIESLGSCDRTL